MTLTSLNGLSDVILIVICLNFSHSRLSFLTPTHSHSLDKLNRAIYSSIAWQKPYCPSFFGSGSLLYLYRCIILSGGSSPGFMNELRLRQRLGDGIDPTVMSLQRQGEEREHYETSHSFSCLSLSPLCPPPVLLSCDGLILQAGESSPLLIHPSPTRDAPLLSSPARPYPALPSHVCSSPIDFGPSRKHSQFHAHALAHRRRRLLIWFMCVYVCINVCQFNSI